MKRHRFTRFCAVFFATAIAIAAFGCTERDLTTSPQLHTKPRVGYLVDYGDPCWYYASLDCYDGTTAGGILDGSQYGSLGGFGPGFTGQPIDDGSGFGEWDAQGEYDDSLLGCRDHPNSPTCLKVRAITRPEWLGCPASVAVNTIDPESGASELWVFTQNYITSYLGVRIGKYSGTYASGGNTATAELRMICGAGMGFTNTITWP